MWLRTVGVDWQGLGFRLFREECVGEFGASAFPV